MNRTIETARGSRVSLGDAADVQEWRTYFAVSETALRRAVDRVGPDRDAVQRELGGRR